MQVPTEFPTLQDFDLFMTQIRSLPLSEQSAKLLEANGNLMVSAAILDSKIAEARAQFATNRQYHGDPGWWGRINKARKYKATMLFRIGADLSRIKRERAAANVQKSVEQGEAQRRALFAFFVAAADTLDDGLLSRLRFAAEARSGLTLPELPESRWFDEELNVMDRGPAAK